jgi:hypothetical protein
MGAAPAPPETLESVLEIGEEELEHILERKAEMLEDREPCISMSEFSAMEIEIADDIFDLFGFEDCEISKCYCLYSYSGKVIRARNRIIEAKRRLIPLTSTSYLT